MLRVKCKCFDQERHDAFCPLVVVDSPASETLTTFTFFNEKVQPTIIQRKTNFDVTSSMSHIDPPKVN